MAAPYLRIQSDSRFTTLNREIDFDEHDENLRYLLDQIDGATSYVGTPYNAGTTYVGGQTYVVGYNGVPYTFVSSSNQTGVTPGTNPAVWQQVTVSSLAHLQNTDTQLAQGTPNQVTAADIRSFLDELTITLSDFNTALTGSELTPGRRYFITDLKLHVVAVGLNSISGYGTYDVFVPNVGTVLEYWDADTAYAVNDKVMDNFVVYKSLTAHTNATAPASDATNWVVLSTSDATAYTLITNACSILWNKSDGVLQINKKIDGNGNEHYQTNELFLQSQNILDLQSTININGHGNGLVVNNNLSRSQITILRYHVDEIANNTLIGSTLYIPEIFAGNIVNNKFYNAGFALIPSSGVSSQVIQNCIFDFVSGTELNIREGAYLNGYRVTNESSTALEQLSSEDAIVSSELNLNFYGNNDIYGVFEIIGADSAMSLVNLASWPAAGFNKIIVKPAPGVVLSVSVIDEFSISTNGQLIGKDIGSFDMFGANGHYMVLERRSAGGFDVVWATLEMLT